MSHPNGVVTQLVQRFLRSYFGVFETATRLFRDFVHLFLHFVLRLMRSVSGPVSYLFNRADDAPNRPTQPPGRLIQWGRAAIIAAVLRAAGITIVSWAAMFRKFAVGRRIGRK